MSNFQEWCVKVLPFVHAAASGEVVQVSADSGSSWCEMSRYAMSDPVDSFDFDEYD